MKILYFIGADKINEHLNCQQYWRKFVAVGCLAVHVHVDRYQEEEALKIALQVVKLLLDVWGHLGSYFLIPDNCLRRFYPFCTS